MKRIVSVVAILITIALGTSPALARGLYAGAGIGNTYFSDEFSTGDVADGVQEIDENSTAWKLFAGYSSRRLISFEGGYRDFGTVESNDADGKIKSQVQGWDIEIMGRIEIAVVDLFAKAGVMAWNSDSSIGDNATSASGTDFLWGLGAGVHFGPIGVRLEWESLEQKEVDNLSVVSLGATFGF